LPGGTKFSSGLSQLGVNVGTSVPPKDAVADAYVISRINSAHQVEAFFGAQRTANNGDSHVDFQFLQDHVGLTGNCGTGFSFTGSREQGDLLVDTNYVNGGGSSAPNVFTWVCPGTPTPAIGTKCDTTGSWVLQNPPVNVANAHSNGGVIPCGGWVCEDGGAGAQNVDSNEFVEGAINLGNLHFGIGCASSLFVETSSSQSGSSQLKAVTKPTNFADCAPTTTTTTPSTKTIQLGQSLTDGVAVSGNAFGTPTGSATFYVCSNTTTGCNPANGTQLTGTPTSPNPVPLDLTGKATSPSYTPPSVGNYCFAGVYTPTSGNFYAPSSDTSAGECFTVTALTPTFTTTRTSGTITFGQSNTDTATVTGNSIGGTPAGSVQFYLCSVPTGSSTCSGGTAQGQPVGLQASPAVAFTATAGSPTVSPAPGSYCFNASYIAANPGNYTSLSSEGAGSNECFTVEKQGSQTATKVVAAQVTFGAGGISDNVSVAPVSNTGPAPTGTVQFYVCLNTTTAATTFCTPSATSQDGSAVGLNVPLSGSTSTATSPVFTPTSAGTWCFSAVYSGDSNYLGSQDNTTSTNTDSSECVTVGKAPTATTTIV
ncbi:MAG TPA: hypothetical protein VFV02_00905, partial [Acidimicrobiales bacterium]|nr:hypothetical protein [Acidimicrobiales bacterium]